MVVVLAAAAGTAAGAAEVDGMEDVLGLWLLIALPLLDELPLQETEYEQGHNRRRDIWAEQVTEMLGLSS